MRPFMSAVLLSLAVMLAGIPKSCDDACKKIPPGVTVEGCPAPLPSPTSAPSPAASPSPLPEPSVSPAPSPAPTAAPSPSPAPTPEPSPVPTPRPSPSPSASPACSGPLDLPAEPVRVQRAGACPAGFDRLSLPGGPGCIAHSACSKEQCLPGDPEISGTVNDCRPARYFLELQASSGHKRGLYDADGLVDQSDMQGNNPHGSIDAYGRRVLNGHLAYPPNSPDGWEYSGLCMPAVRRACAPAPVPSPTPGLQPSPSSTPGCLQDAPAPANRCNGEWEACDCPRFRVQRFGVGVLTVIRDHEVVTTRHGSEKAPAQAGDKVVMNSSPKYNDPGCTRGAVIPGNCFFEGGPLMVPGPEWSGSCAPERDDNPYLASFKPTESCDVTVCMSGVCASTHVFVE